MLGRVLYWAHSSASGFLPGRALARAGSFPTWLFSGLTPGTAALSGEIRTPTRVLGRDSDNCCIFGRDSDAQRGENIQMSPDNHLSVQNPPEDTAMSGTRPKTPPRLGPAMERCPTRDPPGMQSYDEEHNGHRAKSVQRATIAPHGPLAQLAEQGTFNPKV